MYTVQSRVNGSVIDEESCATLGEAWDAIDGRRRLLEHAGAPPVAEGVRQFVVARLPDCWVAVTFGDEETRPGVE